MTRLTGEMQVPNVDHDTHDPLLVASLLDRSVDGPERDRAAALVAACADCAALQQDLIALRAATRSLPTPPRVRDYSLTPEDARRLRRTGWRRLVAVFGSTRDALSRPLAIGLTTIGLAGLLVTSVPGALPGGGASTAALPTVEQPAGGAGSGANSESLGASKEAPAATAAPSAAGPAAAAITAPSVAPSSAPAPVAPTTAPAASGEAFDTFVGAPEPSAGAAGIAPAPDAATQRQGGERDASRSVGDGAASIDRVAAMALAALLFVAGIGLFVLRWVGRRV